MTNKLIYLLLAQNSGTTSETETQTLPFTFKSNGRRLKNYRIYGNTVNGESVGDLVTEGEHAGEYLVPLTVEGKNLFDCKTERIPSLTTNITSMSVNETLQTISITANNTDARIGKAVEIGANYADNLGYKYPCEAGKYYYLSDSNDVFDKNYIIFFNDDNISLGYSQVATTAIQAPNNATYFTIRFGITNSVSGQTYTGKLMITELSTFEPPSIYEPYQTPVTTNLYLPEQIRKVDNKLEYIDFKEQMLHKIRKNLFDNSKATLTNISVSQDQIYHFSPINSGNSGSQILAYSLPLTEDKYYSVSFTAYATVDGAQIRLDGIPDSIYADAHIVDLLINLTSQPIRYTVNHRLFLAGNEKFRLYRAPNTAYANESDIFIYDIQIEETEQCTNYDAYVGNTELYVALPVLPTLSGTNTLSVGTTVQPSKVYLQGKISEAEIVSAEPVQTNVQSLQPLSLDDDDFQLDVMPSNDLQLDVMPVESDLQLDVMPIESDLQLDVMPIESDLQLDVIIPTANLNRIEDDEDAE